MSITVIALVVWGIDGGLLFATAALATWLYVVPTWRAFDELEPPDFDEPPKS